MDNERARGVVGLAMKAGRLVSGGFAVERALKRGAALAVIVDDEASENTKKQLRDACAYRRIPLYELGGLGRAIGKEERMEAAITDRGFAEMLKKRFNVPDEGTGSTEADGDSANSRGQEETSPDGLNDGGDDL